MLGKIALLLASLLLTLLVCEAAARLELLPLPHKRRIIATSFFTNNMWEFDMDTLKLVRRINALPIESQLGLSQENPR